MSFFPNSSHFNVNGTFMSIGGDHNSYYGSTDDKYQELLRRLDLLNYRGDLEKHSDARLEGTCEWSKGHPLIRAWLDSPGNNHLWLYGNPGTGKSTLAAYLVEQAVLRRDPPNQTVVYFFGNNKRQDNGRQNSESILKVFIVQLLQTNHVDQKDLGVLMDNVLSKGRDYRFSVRDLAKHLVLLSKSFPKLHFIVDALDECDTDVAQPGGLIDVLTNMHNPTGKLLFLSRKEEYIQRRLDGWVKMEVGGDRTTQKDIQNFVSAQASELILHIPQLQYTEEELAKALLEAAGNMFLYVRLMVQNLIEHKASSPQDLQNILSNSPNGLDEMYEQYFITLHKKNDEKHNRIAVRALQLVLYSQEPVTLTMLNLALSIEHNDDDLYPNKLHGNIEVVLQQVLGILVDCRKPDSRYNIDDLPTHAVPVHQSLKDFLLRLAEPSRSVPPELRLFRDSMDSRSAHGELLQICCNFFRSRIVDIQLRNCHDLTDQEWQEHDKWWRKFRKMGAVERLTEWQSELRRIKRRILELKRPLKRVLRRERGLTERLLIKTEDLLDLLYMYFPNWLLEQMEEHIVDMWILLQKVVVIQSVLQVPRPMQRSHQLWILPEMELALYSKKHLSSHLAAVVGCSLDHPAITSFTSLLHMSLKNIAHSTSDVAALVDLENIQSPHDVDVIVNLTNTLASIPQIIISIQSLLDLDQEHSPSMLGTVSQYITWYPRFYSTTPLGFTFDECLTRSIDKAQSHRRKEHLKHLLRLSIVACTQLQYVKFILHRFQRQMSIVIGTSSLLYALQNTKQMLARWIVLLVGLNHHEQRELIRLLDHDDFLHPRILVSSKSWDKQRDTSEYNLDSDDDMSDDSHQNDDDDRLGDALLLFDMTLWVRYPFYLSITLSLGFLVGATGLLWISICLVVAASSKHLHYHISKSPSVFGILSLASPFVILGQIIHTCFNIQLLQVTVIIAVIAVGMTLHVSNLMLFSLDFCSEGKLHLRISHVDVQVQKAVRASLRYLLVVNRILPWNTLWYGLSSASFGDMSIHTALNHVAIYIAIHKVLSTALDPLSHAKGIIKEIPHRIDQLYPGLTSRYQGAHDEAKSSNSPGVQINGHLPGISWPPPASYTLTTGTEDSFLHVMNIGNASTDSTSYDE